MDFFAFGALTPTGVQIVESVGYMFDSAPVDLL
jgi:hypothetical protein